MNTRLTWFLAVQSYALGGLAGMIGTACLFYGEMLTAAWATATMVLAALLGFSFQRVYENYVSRDFKNDLEELRDYWQRVEEPKVIVDLDAEE